MVNNRKPPSDVKPAARVLDRVIYVALLTTIVLTAIPYGTVQPWWISVFDCVVFVIAILGVIEVIISKRWPLDLWFVAPLLGLILFAGIQSLPLVSGPGPVNPPTP